MNSAAHPSEPPLVLLADQLAARRESILGAWRAAVAQDPELTIASTLNRVQFLNHIPHVLHVLECKLRSQAHPDQPTGSAHATVRNAAEHGQHRWKQGYDLREVILEWGHLQTTLLQELESLRATQPALDPASLAAAREELARLVTEGISDSAEQFARLQGAATHGQLHEVERAFAELDHADRRRADAWREAAHDLRGQLNLIVSAISLLDDPTLPPPLREESFDLLKKGSKSLHKMFQELLETARLESGRESRSIQPFDAGALLGSLCAMSQPLARERNLSLRADGPPSLPVEGDPGKVQRIAQNLLLNALQYTGRGGVTLSWAEAGPDSWGFTVLDTGPGLANPGAADQRATAAAGEGIGLQVARRLCELLDGSLRMSDVPEGGLSCQVTLPRAYGTA